MERKTMRDRLIALCFAFIGVVGLAQSADPEFRAVWVTRFQWPSADQATAERNITEILEAMAAENFNAVLFQIRGQCDVHYPSPYEPWSSDYDWQDPGFDPVAFAVDEAHRLGLEFHAYINTHTIASPRPPLHTEPEHLYNLHGRPGVEESWVIHDEQGNVVGNSDEVESGGYVWLSPGVPGGEAWTRRAVLHVVETYDVDGVHFDRIRTPGAQYSHDPITQARFEGRGNPNGLDWGGFMRSQITDQLERLRAQVQRVDPSVVISAAPFGINRRLEGGYQGNGTQSYHSWYQDSFTWLGEGYLDMMNPMIYWDIGSAHPYEVLLADFLRHCGRDRHLVAGLTAGRDIIAQIEETRRQGAAGTVLFAHSDELMTRIRESGLYSEPAAIPERPWMSEPTTGNVMGTVRDAAGEPVVDAHVQIDGDSQIRLTGGDGLYAVINVEPGEHTISIYGAASHSVDIEAGEVTVLNFIVPPEEEAQE
jgi:uncharacterized lipoprotein YddW (UPF0748 family)